MGLRCKRCGGDEYVKSGLMRNKQRYLCKSCGLNFTNTPARGKPLALKAAAVLLHVSGLSMNRTAKLLGVSTPTVQAWLEPFAAAYAQKPEPEARARSPSQKPEPEARARSPSQKPEPEARARGPGRGDRAR